jgi:hypothetical protein
MLNEVKPISSAFRFALESNSYLAAAYVALTVSVTSPVKKDSIRLPSPSMSIRFGEPIAGKVAEVAIDGPLGVTETTLLNGYTSVAHSLAPKHPLQLSLAQVGSRHEMTRFCLQATSFA